MWCSLKRKLYDISSEVFHRNRSCICMYVSMYSVIINRYMLYVYTIFIWRLPRICMYVCFVRMYNNCMCKVWLENRKDHCPFSHYYYYYLLLFFQFHSDNHTRMSVSLMVVSRFPPLTTMVPRLMMMVMVVMTFLLRSRWWWRWCTVLVSSSIRYNHFGTVPVSFTVPVRFV